MYSKIFKYDNQGNLILLSIRESQIACVKEILRADEGSPGDSDGRKKQFAHKQISACMWVGDPNSLGNQQGYTGDGLIDDAISNCGLPINWKPNKYCRELIRIVHDHYSGGVAKEYVEGLLQSMRSIISTTAVLNTRILKIITTDEDVSDERISVLSNMQRSLLGMAADAPKHINALKQSIADLRIEEKEREIALGGVEVTYSMRDHD